MSLLSRLKRQIRADFLLRDEKLLFLEMKPVEHLHCFLNSRCYRSCCCSSSLKLYEASAEWIIQTDLMISVSASLHQMEIFNMSAASFETHLQIFRSLDTFQFEFNFRSRTGKQERKKNMNQSSNTSEQRLSVVGESETLHFSNQELCTYTV